MPWADVNGIRMYYESYGQGEPIVFAHGAGGSHLSWWQQVPHFRQKYRCVTFDHRGFGQSIDVENGPGSLAYPEDLRGLMDHLEIERAYLVAQSMGGGTCMGFTIAYPESVKALVMADTLGGMRDPALDEIMRQFRETHPQPTVVEGRAYSPELPKTRPHMAFLYESIRAMNPPREQAPGERDERYVATTEKLTALKVPVQFIVGADDGLVSPDAIKHAATLIPGARFAQAPGCGHSVYWEDAPTFNRIVSEFLEAVEGAAAK
jgi:3-oxoadipate enol-lactonase